jgi:uncharacterized coiled-coil protein SlyX
MKSGEDKDMERIGHLEQAVAVLKSDVAGLKHSTDKNSEVLDAVMQKLTEMDGRKPFSVRESLSTILTTLSIFSLLIVALTYKIDSQAVAAAAPAIKVAEMLMHDGDYFVLKERVSRMEQAIAWRPVIVPTEVASRPAR